MCGDSKTELMKLRNHGQLSAWRRTQPRAAGELRKRGREGGRHNATLNHRVSRQMPESLLTMEQGRRTLSAALVTTELSVCVEGWVGGDFAFQSSMSLPVAGPGSVQGTGNP